MTSSNPWLNDVYVTLYTTGKNNLRRVSHVLSVCYETVRGRSIKVYMLTVDSPRYIYCRTT